MKFKKIEDDFDFRTYASPKDELVNLGKKGKPYLATEYDITLPFCPFCKEPAYESTHCVFCGADFEEETEEDIQKRKELNHEYNVVYKNIRIVQCGASGWLYRDGNLLCHMSFETPQTEKQLLEIAKKYAGE